MANARLLSIASQHRREIVKLNNLARRDWQSIVRHARDESSDTEWARVLRSAFPEIARQYGSPAAQLSASLYDVMREQWIATYGVKRVNSFAANPSLVMAVSDELIDSRLREAGYHIDRYFKGEINRGQVYKPASGLLTAVVGDHSRKEQELLSQHDSFAKGTKRIVRGTGCSYCQFMGWVEWQDGFYMDGQEDGFHEHCSCIEVTEYNGGEEDALYQPWMDKFTEDFNAARDELSELQRRDDERDPKHSVTRNNILRHINAMRAD